MNLRKVTLDNKSDLEFVEKLYIESFPLEERRPVLGMHHLMEEEDKFEVFLLTNDENSRIGFMTCWTFESFVFLEHFAISPEYRSGGNGSEAIRALIDNITLPLIGEIELPETSDFAARRLKFYEKLGFRIWDLPYEQPPYIEDGNSIPMLLLTYGDLDLLKEFETVKNILYTQVYKIN
ncbi:MAG: GNAT family N-acetyltransferase [Dysgonomonas sp.]|nr:GNAT family N-acetyltransferase [Dysgonomonas sp.]